MRQGIGMMTLDKAIWFAHFSGAEPKLCWRIRAREEDTVIRDSHSLREDQIVPSWAGAGENPLMHWSASTLAGTSVVLRSRQLTPLIETEPSPPPGSATVLHRMLPSALSTGLLPSQHRYRRCRTSGRMSASDSDMGNREEQRVKSVDNGMLFFNQSVVDLRYCAASGVQQNDSVTNIFFRLFSIIDYYKALNISPCAIQQSHVTRPFYV